jgi:hypothetical protein
MSSSIRLVARQARQRLARDAGLEPAGIGFLQQQRRDQRGQVRIAAALAQPVQRALDLPRPASTAASELATALPGVVVAMDAQPVAGDAGRDHLGR